MRVLLIGLVFLTAYLIGSVPFGLLIVRLKTGKDIRQVESGRTGGTNAMRAAGFWAGFGTAMFDVLKAAAVVWLAKWIFPLAANPENAWLHALTPLFSILGHNYSIFLGSRDESGRFRLRGGAGGAPCMGGSLGLWAPSLLFIVPLGGLVLLLFGYASVGTMSTALLSTLLFAVLAWRGVLPWSYALYGLAALALLIWALRPNIRRLLNGTERMVGPRAKRKK